jgi:hypothetical protein
MYTEMVNATGLHYVKELLNYGIDPNERPIVFRCLIVARFLGGSSCNGCERRGGYSDI